MGCSSGIMKLQESYIGKNVISGVAEINSFLYAIPVVSRENT